MTFLVRARRVAAGPDEEQTWDDWELAANLSYHPDELDGVAVMLAQTGKLFIGQP